MEQQIFIFFVVEQSGRHDKRFLKKEMAGETVCVSGASGFIASWLVKLLLERGTVRSPGTPSRDFFCFVLLLPSISLFAKA